MHQLKNLTNKIIWLLLGVMIFMTGCDNEADSIVAEENTALSVSAREIEEKIGAQRNAFTKAHISGDTSFLNSIFTHDARILAPGMKAVSGKENIANLNWEWVNYGIHQFEEQNMSFYGNQGIYIDEGTYFMTYGPDSTEDSGKYLNVWKMEEGQWKISTNIWNGGIEAKD
jgi:ketosteroid isomerase-like protein